MIPVSGKKPEREISGVFIHGGDHHADNWRERVREVVFPVHYDGHAYIWDADGKMFCQMRGWGGLTSSGVSDAEAAGLQDRWGHALAAAMNASAELFDAESSATATPTTETSQNTETPK